MKDLDLSIDKIGKEKVIGKIQENAVRLKKINVRFITSNRKHTLERFDHIYRSYEKLLKDFCKEYLSVEKTLRIRYRVPLEESRKIRLIAELNEQMEQVLESMLDEYGVDYDRLSRPGTFDEKLELTRTRFKETLENQIRKITEVIQQELEREGIINPDELCRMYGIEEQALFDMRLISPLQEIHRIMNELAQDGKNNKIFEGVKEAFFLTIQIGQKLEKEGDLFSPEARKKKKLKLAKAGFMFKELVPRTHTLLIQLQGSPESRNRENIRKIWGQIQEIFQGMDDEKTILAKIEPLYEHTLGGEN